MLKVSVIIPNFNHACYLEQRIESVLNQTYQEFELILLDDFSGDDSRKVLDKYKDHPKVTHVVYNDKNSGSPFYQWQKGIGLAKGEIVWIAESDDYSDPLFLETLLPEFSDEKVGIVYCSSHWVDDKGVIKDDLSMFNHSFKASGPEIYIDQLVYNCTIQNVSSALLRKSVISNHLPELSKFKYCGDWVFYADILSRCNISYTNIKLNYFRWYHINTSHQAVKLGKWTDEGVHVLKFLPISNLITIGKVFYIYKYWDKRIKEISGFRRRISVKLYLLLYSFFGLIQCTLNRIPNEKK